MIFTRAVGMLALVFAFQFSMPRVAAADEVLDWNTIAFQKMQIAPAVPAHLQARLMAIVHVSMFDAVNGIQRRYEPIHFDSVGPRSASQRAAVVQAAYRALVTLLPARQAALDSDLAASLAALPASDSAAEIQRGRDFGEQVALAILAWRAGDKITSPSPYLGSLEVGKWRPTPRPNPVPGGPELDGLPGATPLLGSSTPFVIPASSTFRAAGPPALTSREYARDVNEVKRVGERGSIRRTADQTESARFWGGSPVPLWNRAAADASRQRNLKLHENTRLFALLNVAMNDAEFTVWDSKYYFELWRPIHAIRFADADSNSRTIADPLWTPLLVTPPYPEYTSGHQGYARAAATVLTRYFGKRMGFEAFSEFLPGVVRSWPNYAAAADEAFMARIWSGIHFRTAMHDTRYASEKIARFVMRHAARPVHDREDDDDDDD